MPVVTNTVLLPDGSGAQYATVVIRLVANATVGTEAPGYVGTSEILGTFVPAVSSAGVWSLTLTANSLITPSGTVYQISTQIPGRPVVVEYISVPNGAGPYTVSAILTSAPSSITPTELAAHLADTVDAHDVSAITDALPRSGRKVPRNPLTFTDLGVGHIPRSVGVDGYVYATEAATNRIIRTQNGFSSVEQGQLFSSLGDSRTLIYATKTAEGFVAVLSTKDVDSSGIYFSTSFASGWSKVLEAKNFVPFTISSPTVYGGATYIFAGEYITGATRDLYMTANGGQTWSVIKTHTRVDLGSNSHWHKAVLNPTTGRIWAVAGDALNAWTGYSDNLGSTWTAVPAGGIPIVGSNTYHQPTVMEYLGSRLFVTPDEGIRGPGVWQMNPTTGAFNVEFVFQPIVEQYRQFGRHPVVKSGGDYMLILFPPVDGLSQTNTTYIVGTNDGGLSWHILYTESYTQGTDEVGEDGIVGPDSAGRVFYPKKVSGTQKLYRAFATKWESVGDVASTHTVEARRSQRGTVAGRPSDATLYRGFYAATDGAMSHSDGLSWRELVDEARLADLMVGRAVGVAAVPIGEYISAPGQGLGVSNGLGNGTLRFRPFFVPTDMTFDRIGASVTVAGEAGSLVRLGIYNRSASTNRPTTLVLDAGTIAGDSATAQAATISQALTRGWYYLAAAVQSAPTTQPTIRTMYALHAHITSATLADVVNVNAPSYQQTGVTGALPASASVTATAATVPVIAMRRSA